MAKKPKLTPEALEARLDELKAELRDLAEDAKKFDSTPKTSYYIEQTSAHLNVAQREVEEAAEYLDYVICPEKIGGN